MKTMLKMLVAGLVAVLAAGCGTIMPAVQQRTDGLASKVPGGSKWLAEFRRFEGQSAGMVRLPEGWELASRHWYEGKQIDLTKVIEEPYLKPKQGQAAVVTTNEPAPPVEVPTTGTGGAALP